MSGARARRRSPPRIPNDELRMTNCRWGLPPPWLLHQGCPSATASRYCQRGVSPPIRGAALGCSGLWETSPHTGWQPVPPGGGAAGASWEHRLPACVRPESGGSCPEWRPHRRNRHNRQTRQNRVRPSAIRMLRADSTLSIVSASSILPATSSRHEIADIESRAIHDGHMAWHEM